MPRILQTDGPKSFQSPDDQGRWSNLFGVRFREVLDYGNPEDTRLDPTSVFVQRAVLHRRKRSVFYAFKQATDRYAVSNDTTLADYGNYSSMFCDRADIACAHDHLPI